MKFKQLFMFVWVGILCSFIAACLSLITVIVFSGEAPIWNPIVVIYILVPLASIPMSAQVLWHAKRD